jgi:Pex19 protein family
LAVDPASGELPQVDPAFTQSISDVLKGLSQGQENIQQQSFSEEAIAGMFGNINLNESGENNAFLPFMQGMMQSLLSGTAYHFAINHSVETNSILRRS